MENRSKKVRFNIVDLVIIVLVAAVGVGVMALRNRAAGAEAAKNTVPMRCTVECIKVTPGIADVLHEGDSVYNSVNGAYLGKVASFSSAPHVETEYSAASGGFVQYECPEAIDLCVTIEGSGYATERDVVIGSDHVKIGASLAIKGRGFAREGYVIGIDTMDAQLPENTEDYAGDGTALYTIRLDDAREFYAANLHVGDRIYEAKTGGFLGVVEGVATEPFAETNLGTDGVGRLTEKPESYTVLLQVRGGFAAKPDGYYLGGTTELKVGATVNVESRYISRSGIFASIESIEGTA